MIYMYRLYGCKLVGHTWRVWVWSPVTSGWNLFKSEDQKCSSSSTAVWLFQTLCEQTVEMTSLGGELPVGNILGMLPLLFQRFSGQWRRFSRVIDILELSGFSRNGWVCEYMFSPTSHLMGSMMIHRWPLRYLIFRQPSLDVLKVPKTNNNPKFNKIYEFPQASAYEKWRSTSGLAYFKLVLREFCEKL